MFCIEVLSRIDSWPADQFPRVRGCDCDVTEKSQCIACRNAQVTGQKNCRPFTLSFCLCVVVVLLVNFLFSCFVPLAL